MAPLRFITRDYNRRVDDRTFSYHCCPACETIFIHPMPSNLGQYYPADYYTIPNTLEQLRHEAEVDRPKLDLLTAVATRGRLLEIGPAFGYFAHLSKEAGFTVEAIEMDAACCQFLCETIGIRVAHTDDTVEALKTMEPFDVIAMWHVIEHLPQPWTTLAAVAERLRPGGSIILAAPNPDAFQFSILGKLWTHVDAPRHVQLIPMKLIRERLQGFGLTQVLATTTDAAAIAWDRFGWQMSFGNFGRGRVLRKAFRILGQIIAWVMIPWDRRPGLGSTYTMIFRKDSVP